MLEKIEIQHELDFQEICSRLRKVSLRGFPNVNIYKNSKIEIDSISPLGVMGLFTPQPSVYAPILNRIKRLSDLFSEKGIDIFQLQGGYDYLATDETGEITEWTLIPPIVEVLPIKFNSDRGLDYTKDVGAELIYLMREKGYRLNPELQDLDYPEYGRFKGKTMLIPEICDGSHRVEAGSKKGLQNLIFITSPEKGFPYYAAPKPYSCVHEEPERDEDKSDKTHVLTSPGHKLLYRLFPSGGILSGTVRPTKEKFD
jgi:hypothetical protein